MMQVTKSTVTKLEIKGADRLDPITVFLEDFEPKRGKITVTCYGESWTAYWGGMWDGMRVGEFFTKHHEEYIAGYFAPHLSSEKFCGDTLVKSASREVLKQRRRGQLEPRDARELYDQCEGLSGAGSTEILFFLHPELMMGIFGDEWWLLSDELASVPNPKYQYLCRIIRAVQQALKETTNDIQ